MNYIALNGWIYCGFGWGKWLCSDNEAEREEACELATKCLRLASWIGAETVLVMPDAALAEKMVGQIKELKTL